MIEKLFGEPPRLFKDETELRSLWSQPNAQSVARWIGRTRLRTRVDGRDRKNDFREKRRFRHTRYTAFAIPAITRQERVDERRPLIMSAQAARLAAFIDFVMGQYRDKLAPLLTLKYRSVADAVAELGGVPSINDAFLGAQRQLFS
jgi:type I restriction enzyme R subunit